MNNRKELSDILHSILPKGYVYFQPPENTKIKYDCIVYKRVGYDSRYANNKTYNVTPHYQLTYIHKNPDSDVPVKLLNTFQMIRETSSFISDGLYHDVFDLYF